MSPHDNEALARIVREAEARLTGERPRFINWSDTENLVAGVLVSTGKVPDKFREGEFLTNLMLRQPNGRLVSALAYLHVQRQLDQAHGGGGVLPGDVIAIKRGGLVERPGDLPDYREWSVEVVEGDPGIAAAAAHAGSYDEPPESFGEINALDPGTAHQPGFGGFTRGGEA